LFKPGEDDVLEGSGEVSEEAELEALDFGGPEGFGGEEGRDRL